MAKRWPMKTTKNCSRATMTNLEELAFRLAPEFATAELRILPHQDAWPPFGDAFAYAVRGAHVGIRDYLRGIGEWSGRWGSYIVIVGEYAAEKLLGLIIHECAHLVPSRPPHRDTLGEATEEDRKIQATHI